MTATRRYLVTGAGSGIGLAITQALAAMGHQVLAGARRDDDLERLATLDRVTPLRLDVSDACQLAAARRLAEAQGLGLHGLVHNAGIGGLGHLMAWSDADLQRIFEVNLFAAQRLTRELLAPLLQARGRIVCIGSQGGSITQPMFGPYTMTKHALEAFAECLRQEMAPHGVAVSIVQPGAVATRIGQSAQAANEARLRATPRPFDAAAQQTLAQWSAAAAPRDDEPESATSRRPAPPQKVAEVVLHALLDARPQARYLVGTRWEGDRVLRALADRLLDAALSPSHEFSRDQLVALIDEALARRQAALRR